MLKDLDMTCLLLACVCVNINLIADAISSFRSGWNGHHKPAICNVLKLIFLFLTINIICQTRLSFACKTVPSMLLLKTYKFACVSGCKNTVLLKVNNVLVDTLIAHIFV